MYIRKKKLKENQVPIDFSMCLCLCMIFCKINIRGSWGDVNKVLNKCPNDELYICEGFMNILHNVCVIQKCTDACCMDT